MIARNDAALIGTSIAHYRILSLLGHGGMGDVYLANDTKLGRRVALKLISTADRRRLRRFEVEARSASALNHPNVCVIHEIGDTDDGQHFIAMEHIDGITLRQRLKSGPIAPIEAIDIALQIAAALEAAHHAGVIHRDIKPENVMLRSDGYVKVLDFGLAKLTERYDLIVNTDGPTMPVSHAQPGLLIGTINYLSPEQARGEEVDERTDLWSLGVVLYEMLTASMPFSGETPSHAIVAILETEPSSLADISPKLPAELDWIVKKALRKDRKKRYQSAAEVARDLRQLRESTVSGRAVPTRPIVPRRNGWRQLIPIAALVLVAIAISVVLFRRGRDGTAASTTNIDSLAVLPFANGSSDPQIDYLSDGITESLINNLSQLPNVKVIGRNSVFRYKGQQPSPHAVGQDLSVKAVLSGRIVQRGNEVSIYVVLENAADNSHIWGEQYNRQVSDILTIQ
ncbi:MAG TPA: serine/threonine-protein kinase, partial [Pyrinomonadaceae bacterium]